MSVIKAILFYSKRDVKSSRMKNVVDSVGVDLDTVSVDSLEVRERLLDDDTFGIHEVPSVLVIYSSGQHKTYTGKQLDSWFDQLLQNIQELHAQQQPAPQPMPQPMPEQVTSLPPLEDVPPKPLRKGHAHVEEIPSGLPAPGRPIREPTSTPITGELINIPEQTGGGITGGGSGMSDVTAIGSGGVGGASGAHAAMVTEHIKDAEPLIPITSEQPKKKPHAGVKSDGPSAAELAKQMAKQREEFEEKIEDSRPFI